MTDDVWRRDEIESPCIKVCIIHPDTRLCAGCGRTVEEIGDWSRMTPETRRVVMDALPARMATTTARRGGRAARIARYRDQGLSSQSEALEKSGWK